METVRINAGDREFSELLTYLETELPDYDVSVATGQTTQPRGSFPLEAATIIVSGAAVLSALISSLLTYLGKKHSGMIKITGKSGRTIEIPNDTPPEKVQKILQFAREIDVDEIRLY